MRKILLCISSDTPRVSTFAMARLMTWQQALSLLTVALHLGTGLATVTSSPSSECNYRSTKVSHERRTLTSGHTGIPSSSLTSISSTTKASCAPRYEQCGGLYFTGPTCCQSAPQWECSSVNAYYSTCGYDYSYMTTPSSSPAETTTTSVTFTTTSAPVSITASASCATNYGTARAVSVSW
jgi:hypothetical protein